MKRPALTINRDKHSVARECPGKQSVGPLTQLANSPAYGGVVAPAATDA